eukprot:51108-Rhodomonas_salina.1
MLCAAMVANDDKPVIHPFDQLPAKSFDFPDDGGEQGRKHRASLFRSEAWCRVAVELPPPADAKVALGAAAEASLGRAAYPLVSYPRHLHPLWFVVQAWLTPTKGREKIRGFQVSGESHCPWVEAHGVRCQPRHGHPP